MSATVHHDTGALRIITTTAIPVRQTCNWAAYMLRLQAIQWYNERMMVTHIGSVGFFGVVVLCNL